MTEAVIVALIAAGSSVLVQLVISAQSREETNSKLEKALAVQDTRLDGLTQEVRKHNQVLERTYKLESEVAVIQTRLNDMEDDRK